MCMMAYVSADGGPMAAATVAIILPRLVTVGEGWWQQAEREQR